MNKKKILVISIVAGIVICIIVAIIVINKQKEEKIDVYINTNYFITKIQRILNEEENYNNKTVLISGYIHYDEIGRRFIARNGITSTGKKAFGLMLDGDFEKFPEGKWVKVKGTIQYVVSDYTTGEKVPYIHVITINEAKEQPDDRNVIN